MVAGCSGPGPGTPSTPPPAAAPADALLRLDELPVPGFTVVDVAKPVSVDAVADGDPGLAGQLRGDGFRDAATERFFRAVPDLGGSNGPVDVVMTVSRYSDVAGAMAAFALAAAAADRRTGATPLSPGPLGDQGHAVLRTAPSGAVTVAETLVEWRVGALVTTLTVRERLGGSPLAHALEVARPALVRQHGATPVPAAA